MKENRREFLKKSCRVLSMAALATQMRHFGLVNIMAQEKADVDNVKSAGGDDYKALVCVFLDGGNDGHNSVIPNYDEGYNLYSAARGGSFGLAVPRNELLPITPSSMSGQVYGLNPRLAELHELWQLGKMAVVCNVGCLVQPLTRVTYQSGAPRPYQLFSHPDQAEQFKTAISSHKSTTGWGGRVADRTSTLNPGGAVPMITSIAGASIFNNGASTKPLIIGAAPTPLNQLLTLNGFTDADAATRITAMNNARTRDLNYTLIQQASTITQQAVNVSQQLSTDPTLTVTFPATSLGNQLRQVAKLIKLRTLLNMSRQIFFVQIGGFDHHSNQIGNHDSLLTQVSRAIRAFYDETVAQGVASQVTTFTMSDFNRTLNPAGSGSSVGTDHGWGGPYFVVGGAVAGGNFYGRPTANGTFVPSLVMGTGDDADVRGRFIPSVSVEQYAATLARWYGLADADIPLAFPNIGNFSGSNLGFMM